MKLFTMFITLLFVLGLQIGWGQVPRSITIQGVLTSDKYVKESYTVIKTTIHESASEPNYIFTQVDTVTIQKDGLFTITLGKEKGIPSYILFDKQYFVQFTVNDNQIPLRIPLQTVPYALTSEKVSNSSVNVEHLSDDLKSLLNINNKDNPNKSEKNLANYVGGLKSVIAGGDENRTSANFSSILGGYTNNVSGAYGVVTGGQSNFVGGNWSFVGGGKNNRAFGSWSNSVGGLDNIVTSSSSFGTIAGGQQNQINANHAAIGGGQSNTSGGLGSTVSGGISNRAMQSYATVGGGLNNFSTGMYSSILGGSGNNATSTGAVVSGGLNNKANGQQSSIMGGSENTIGNAASHSYISGGFKNTINSGNYSGASGANNTISLSNNAFAVGSDNTISSSNNGIAIGSGNQVSGMNAIAMGTGNIASSQNEVVLGSFASTSSNPANTSNTSFTGDRVFTVGNGNSSGQRKNALTIFENGNTLVQGKMLISDTAFLDNTKIKRLMLETPLTASNLSGTNTGDVTIGTANGLSLTGQTLSLSTATTTASGAMSSSDKTKLDGISSGAEVNVNSDWNATSGDAEILNKPTLGTMSAEIASDYYTKSQTDVGFQVKDADLSTVATIGSSDQLLRVKNDGSGLEWFTPTYISSYNETDPQVGTITSNGIPRWSGTALVTGSLSDNGTNVSTSGTFTSSNLTGTNTGDVTIGTANGLSVSGQVLSLSIATTTTAGAMSAADKAKLDGISSGGSSAQHGYQTFTQTTTFQVPAGITQLYVQLWGGGGGGGSNRCGSLGGGGGSGGYVSATIAVVPGEVLQLTIGNGGVGDQTNGGCNCGCDPNGQPGQETKITRTGSNTAAIKATGGQPGGGACRNGSTGWAGAVCAITTANGSGGQGGSFVFNRGEGVFISSSTNGNNGNGANGGAAICISGTCYGAGGNNMTAGSVGAIAIDW